MASAPCHGYDADFVSDVWEELKCIICHLVLRQPVQHMNCGHRYCSPCYEEMKKYAERLNTKLICPIDREDIDVAMVFEDRGIHRSIRALEVKCKQEGDGCFWVGCLSDLEEHLGRCQYQRKQDSAQPNNTLGGNDYLYKQLLERIEEVSVGKEKEIASLKFSVKELKEDMKTMKEEMKTMKEVNNELKLEILSLKKADTIFKNEYEAEMKSLHQQLQMNKSQPSQTSSGAVMVNQPVKDEKTTPSTLSEFKVDQCKPIGVEKQLSLKEDTRTPKVYFDLRDMNGGNLGRIIIDLYFDKAPLACAKFVKLCTHEMGVGYKETVLSSLGNCLWGPSKLNESLPPELISPHENRGAKHDRKGLVTMIQQGGQVESMFCILLKPFSTFDNLHVIIGEVTKGTLNVVQKITKDPFSDVKVMDCGFIKRKR